MLPEEMFHTDGILGLVQKLFLQNHISLFRFFFLNERLEENEKPVFSIHCYGSCINEIVTLDYFAIYNTK